MNAQPNTVHILVVDDDDELRDAVAATLRQAGFVVTEAAGVRDGLVVLSQQIPDAVLTDLQMPDGSGRDILEHAGKLPAKPAVIVMSGSMDERTGPELLAAGAVVLLRKPFSMHQLVAAVATSVGL